MSQILLIDDDLGTLDTFSAILRLAGHAVTVASTGRDGVALALAAHFDAILIDLALPDISGLDVIRSLHHRGTPIVLVTAVTSTQTAVAAIRLGARDYIEKPVKLGSRRWVLVAETLRYRNAPHWWDTSGAV